MSLAQEATAGPPAAKTKAGKVARWLASLEQPDREAAEAVLRNAAWTHADVHALFARHGLDVTRSSLSLFRKEHYGSL